MGFFDGAINAIASLFGAGINAYTAERDRRTQISMFNANMRDNALNRRFQSDEAEKQRKFNSSEAAMARLFAKEQADKAYARNSYSAQVAQMKAAGLNPALAYGGSSFQPMGNVDGPAASSSASPSGNAGASGSITPYGFDAMSVARQIAEIDNIKAQTKKTEAEATGQETENKWIDLKNKATVDSLNMSVTVGDSVKNLNDAQFDTLTKNLKTIELQWDETREKIEMYKAQTSGYKLDNQLKEIEKRFKTPYMESIINKISAETNLSKFQVFRGMKLLTLEALNIQADTANKSSMASLNHFLGVKQFQENSVFYDNNALYQEGLKIQNGQLLLDLEGDKTYKGIERSVGIFEGICNGVSTLLGGASAFQSSGLFKRGSSRSVGFSR